MGKVIVYGERLADGTIRVIDTFPLDQPHFAPDEYLRLVRHGTNVSIVAEKHEHDPGERIALRKDDIGWHLEGTGRAEPTPDRGDAGDHAAPHEDAHDARGGKRRKVDGE
jgi:hypothetical protein